METARGKVSCYKNIYFVFFEKVEHIFSLNGGEISVHGFSFELVAIEEINKVINIFFFVAKNENWFFAFFMHNGKEEFSLFFYVDPGKKRSKKSANH